MEQALLEAWRDGELEFPLMRVDFSEHFPDIGAVTSLDAPHRIADAVFRESMLDDTPFRDSEAGQRFEQSTVENATGIYHLCPTALIFGAWDSTGAGGALGNKFARCLVSEIVGIDIEKGVRPTGRISPIGIQGTERRLYKTPDNRFTYDEDKADIENGNPVQVKPSEVNLGNIAPSFVNNETGEQLHGGVTMDHAEQSVVLTLAGLRKLRFPDEDGETSRQKDRAHHRVLAALGLAAVTLQQKRGYDLRSRCTLVPEEPPEFEVVENTGDTRGFTLSTSDAIDLYNNALSDAAEQGITWEHETIDLEPTEDLVRLVKESRGMVETEET